MMHMNTPHTVKSIRVTVPVSPEVLAKFQRLSKVAGQSVGRAMGEWLEETQTGLDPMIDILETHKKAPLKAIQTLQNYSSTLNDLTGDLFARVAKMDGSVEQLGAVAAAARRDGLFEAKGGLTPPSSNTGGKVGKTATKRTGGSK